MPRACGERATNVAPRSLICRWTAASAVLEDRDTDLIAAGIDVALLIGRLTDSVVTARKIGQCQRHVIGTPAYFAAAGTPRTPADLLGHQAIIYEQRDGSPTRTFSQGTSETSVALSGRLRVSAMEGVREGVPAGLGFAIASKWAFAPELKSGAVQAVLTDWSLPPVDLPTGQQGSAKARGLCKLCRNPNVDQRIQRLRVWTRIAAA